MGVIAFELLRRAFWDLAPLTDSAHDFGEDRRAVRVGPIGDPDDLADRSGRQDPGDAWQIWADRCAQGGASRGRNPLPQDLAQIIDGPR